MSEQNDYRPLENDELDDVVEADDFEPRRVSSHVFSVRLSKDEASRFASAAEELGIPLGTFLKQAADKFISGRERARRSSVEFHAQEMKYSIISPAEDWAQHGFGGSYKITFKDSPERNLAPGISGQ